MMSWFDQLSIWDKAPKGKENWRTVHRAKGETFAVEATYNATPSKVCVLGA